MHDKAALAFLADFLSGRDSILLAGSNAEAGVHLGAETGGRWHTMAVFDRLEGRRKIGFSLIRGLPS